MLLIISESFLIIEMYSIKLGSRSLCNASTESVSESGDAVLWKQLLMFQCMLSEILSSIISILIKWIGLCNSESDVHIIPPGGSNNP